VQQINSPVYGFTEDSAGRLWFVSAGKLHSLKDNLHQEYALPAAVTRQAGAVAALHPLKDGSLLLAYGRHPVRFNPENVSFDFVPARNEVARMDALGLLKDGMLCLQSRDAEPAGGKYHYDLFDGTRITPLADAPPVSDFPDGFSTLFADRDGDFWLGGAKGGVAWFHDREWSVFRASDAGIPDAVVGFAQLPDGKMWCATRNSIVEFDGQSWISVRSGFDHINSLVCARDGKVWIADDGGLYLFHQNAWIENGVEECLPGGAVLGVFADQRGRIWTGTTRGLSRQHPEADPDPPRASIEQSGGRESLVREGGSLTLAFIGQDKWKFTGRERLLFSYRLDGRDWSSFQPGDRATLSDLPAGKHFFQVRAMDRNGNIDPKPASLDFSVVLPWYKEIRLVLISLVGGAIAIFFAALAFNRHRRLVRSHAEVELKVAERTRELELAHQALLHSQKMNALGTLAAGVAHDFNNILSIVKGSAQIIEDNLENPRKIRTRVDRIKTVVEQGSGIVKAMLGFSRDSEGQPDLCAPNEVVADTIKLLGDRFLREIEVKFEPAPDLPAVSASKVLIQQVLLNFIFNAADAVTEQKHIVLSTSRSSRLPLGMVLMPAVSAREYVSLRVQDSGCGIAPENLPRIFEPFFTTKAFSTRRGTGLGLSMVYELARKLEAGLAVESVLGKGSTFTLVLPVRDVAGGVEA
jgi:signal transduction histidine kinase